MPLNVERGLPCFAHFEACNQPEEIRGLCPVPGKKSELIKRAGALWSTSNGRLSQAPHEGELQPQSLPAPLKCGWSRRPKALASNQPLSLIAATWPISQSLRADPCPPVTKRQRNKKGCREVSRGQQGEPAQSYFHSSLSLPYHGLSTTLQQLCLVTRVAKKIPRIATSYLHPAVAQSTPRFSEENQRPGRRGCPRAARYNLALATNEGA